MKYIKYLKHIRETDLKKLSLKDKIIGFSFYAGMPFIILMTILIFSSRYLQNPRVTNVSIFIAGFYIRGLYTTFDHVFKK